MSAPSTEIIPQIILNLAVMLFAAKIFGDIVERYFKQPEVLGELIAGIILSPFAFGPLFGFYPVTTGPIPVSPEIDMIANIGVILLLFLVGIETDFEKFIKFGKVGGLVGFAGIVLPFFLGFYTIEFFYKGPYAYGTALFTGAMMTATSVGITARVLQDMGKLNTEEGTTILSAAVIDDVLGIIVLAIVIAIAGVNGAPMSTWEISVVVIKAIVFWVVLLFFGLKFSDKISQFLHLFKGPGSQLAVAISFGLFISYVAYLLGLAMIIGAYAAGLALSSSAHKEFLAQRLRPIYEFLVPIFFVVMGMLVDVRKIPTIAELGLLIVIFAILGKYVGCAIAAYVGGFNKTGSSRVGFGMIPRGEVGLIVAYYGLSYGVVTQEIYVIAVVMSFVTTMITPMLLKYSFARGPESGWTGEKFLKKKKA